MNNIKVYKTKEQSSQNKTNQSNTKESKSQCANNPLPNYEQSIKVIEQKNASKDIEDVTESKIEQILIDIYNNYITFNCEDIQISEVPKYKNEIRALAQTFDDQCSLFIMKTLLSKIKELIQRYKDKIYEIIEISNIRENIIRRNKTPEQYTSRQALKSCNKKQCLRLKSYTKRTYTNNSYNKNSILTVFTELVNIKIILIKSSNDIEEVFKYAKREFSEFSIEQCQREEYLNVIVKDDFIQYIIQHNRNSELLPLIEEIEEDKALNINQMTLFTEAVDNYKPKIANKCKGTSFRMSCFNRPSPSPILQSKESNECCKNTNLCFDDLFAFITCDSKKDLKAKKQKKKKKKEKKCCAIEQLCSDVVDGFKTCLNKASINSSKCQKIKSTISDDWLNKLKGQYINSKGNCDDDINNNK